jgi:hypothetical protein
MMVSLNVTSKPSSKDLFLVVKGRSTGATHKLRGTADMPGRVGGGVAHPDDRREGGRDHLCATLWHGHNGDGGRKKGAI